LQVGPTDEFISSREITRRDPAVARTRAGRGPLRRDRGSRRRAKRRCAAGSL